jgi:hypothetical protein
MPIKPHQQSSGLGNRLITLMATSNALFEVFESPSGERMTAVTGLKYGRKRRLCWREPPCLSCPGTATDLGLVLKPFKPQSIKGGPASFCSPGRGESDFAEALRIARYA